MPGAGARYGHQNASAGWTPASLTNLVDYWYGDLGITIGTGVSQWLGQFASTALVQATGGNQPANTPTQNSLKGVRFDGSNDYLNGTLGATFGGNTGTFFAVLKAVGTPSGNTRLLSLKSSDQAHDYDNTASIAAMLHTVGSDKWDSYYNGSQRTSQTAADASAHIVITQRNGDTMKTWVDGSAGSDATGLGTSNFSIEHVALGAEYDGTANCAVDIFAVGFYSDFKNATDVGAIFTNLNARYAVY